MTTKIEWQEYFELMNGRTASSEEIAGAYANGEIERSSEEISLSESAVNSQSEAEALAMKSTETKPTKEEWLDYFETISGRKPNLAEFQAAKMNGEFQDSASLEAQNTSQSMAQTSAPQFSQAQQDFQQSSFQQSSYQQQSYQPSFSARPRDTFGRVVQSDVVNAQPTAIGKVGFVEAFKLFFQNYVNFKGRSSRAEYWYVVIWMGIISIIPVIMMIAAMASTVSAINSYGTYSSTSSTSGLGASLGAAGFGLVLMIIFGLATIVPLIALTVRRFRDVGISHIGYIGLVIIGVILSFLQFIPVLGSLVILAFSIYEIVLTARPSDYYLTNKEPITDWVIAHFGEK